MKISFWLGLGLGAISGACIVSGNRKLREMIEEHKEKMEEKMDTL